MLVSSESEPEIGTWPHPESGVERSLMGIDLLHVHSRLPDCRTLKGSDAPASISRFFARICFSRSSRPKFASLAAVPSIRVRGLQPVSHNLYVWTWANDLTMYGITNPTQFIEISPNRQLDICELPVCLKQDHNTCLKFLLQGLHDAKDFV